MSAFISIARASASFIFQPPDSDATAEACISSVKPTDDSTRETSSRPGAVVAMTDSSLTMKSTTGVSASDESMSCST